jgi:hypothetical protein
LEDVTASARLGYFLAIGLAAVKDAENKDPAAWKSFKHNPPVSDSKAQNRFRDLQALHVAVLDPRIAPAR